MAACAICLDEKPEDPVEVSGDIVCAECVHEDIMPLFYKAVEHESNYPVRPWGEAEELDPEDFVDFFDDLGEADEFIEEWTIKVWEYSTLRKDRLYCSGCGIFVENKRFPMLVSGNSVACDKCSTETCVTCGNDATRRNCRRQSCVPREADMSAFDGLIKGKDWQTCPNVNCETPVQLLDGCNGPRYNLPGAANAFFDDPDASEDDEDHFEDDGEHFEDDEDEESEGEEE